MSKLSRFAQQITEEMQRVVAGERPQLWVGQTLLDTLPSLTDECYATVPAYPSMDILSNVNLTRDELQHVYASWAPQVFADICTAILSPQRATSALETIATAANTHHGMRQDIPWIIRGHVLSEVLQTSFHSPGRSSDLTITLDDGETYALQASVVAQDVRTLVQHMLGTAWDSLGSNRLHELVPIDKKPSRRVEKTPTAVQEKPTPTPSPATKPAQVALKDATPFRTPSIPSPYQESKTSRKRRSRKGHSMKRLVRDAILVEEINKN